MRQPIYTDGALTVVRNVPDPSPGVVPARPVYELTSGDTTITVTERSVVRAAIRILEDFV